MVMESVSVMPAPSRRCSTVSPILISPSITKTYTPRVLALEFVFALHAAVQLRPGEPGLLHDGDVRFRSQEGGNLIVFQQGSNVVIPVPGRSVDSVRNNPYLQEFQGLRGAAVKFAVLDARSGAHHLDFSARDGMAVVQAVPVAEFSFQGDGNHFHIFVRMGAESFFRENLVVVEHAQSSELHAFRVEIIGEAECVVCIQPSVVGMSTGGCTVNGNVHN